jgi:hypothetical protein
MKSQWMSAALLSSALIVGCGDSGSENSQNLEQNPEQAPVAASTGADQVNPPAATAPAPSSSARVDNSAVQDTRPDTRPAQSAPARPRVTAPPAAPAPAAAPRATWREVTVPANTTLPLELLTALSSETAQVETPVRARVRNAVTVDGYTVIPAGSTVVGEVFEVERAGRVKGRARIAIRFNEVQMNGTAEALRTNPVIFQGEATKGEDATKIGVGAGIGAALGGILGGGDGAAKGAAIGGAAGTGAVLATRGQEVELASGTDVDAVLASPLDVRVSMR